MKTKFDCRQLQKSPILLKLIMCIIILMGWAINGNAQVFIEGKVIDNVNNIPVGGANIEVIGTTVGTVSEENGFFHLYIDKPLPIKLAITYVGYELKEVLVTKGADNLLISMVPGALVGQEVVVSASRKREKLQEAPSAIDVIDERVLKADVVSNPFLSLRNRAGLDIVQTGVSNGHITLRGRTTAFQTETFVIADYRNLILPGLGAISYDQMPVDPIDLEKIEIVKGPGSALYGPGVESGIVHFISKSPFDAPGTSLSVGGGTRNAVQASFRHAQSNKLGSFAYKLTGFYRRADDWEIDTSNAVEAARLATFSDNIVSSITGEPIAQGIPDYTVESYGFTGTLAFRPDDITTITTTGGWSVGKGIFRTSQGEGYTKSPRPFFQTRVQRGDLFAQVFWSYQDGRDGNSYLYSSGATQIFEGHQIEGQVQYNFKGDFFNIVTGVDYRLNKIDTKGTIHGRYENDDNYTILGSYAQGEVQLSSQLNLVAATRLDYFSALEEWALSPRLGFVYKPSPKHTFRLTFNRAIGAPAALNLFGDFPITNNGTFLTHLIGGSDPLTFDNPQTTSLIPGIGATEGIGMDLQNTYAAITTQLAQSGALSAEALAYLESTIPNIQGTSAGALSQNFRPRGKLELSSSNMIEVGYQGLIRDKVGISAEVYFNRRNNVFGTLFQASPFVLQPNLPQDLSAAINGGINEQELLQATGLSKEELVNLYAGAAQGIAFDPETGEPNILGLVEATQTPGDALPNLAVTYYNSGAFSYLGVDVAVKYYYSSNITAFGSFSYLSQGFFEDLPVGEEDSGATLDFSLNIPTRKFKVGVEYNEDLGPTGYVILRNQNSWQSDLGLPWRGPVDAFTMIDLGAGYNLSENLSANVTVTNLFEADYRAFFGAPKIGRQILAKVYYTFK